MVVIRMRRAGSKNRPFYRIVVTESAAAREGRFIEILGHYNPRTNPETLVLDRERLAHWMGHGAKPSDTLRTLIARAPEVVAADAAAATPAAQ
jgi:small subunit ribosomal protein S16